jgi:hypothetical protein
MRFSSLKEGRAFHRPSVSVQFVCNGVPKLRNSSDNFFNFRPFLNLSVRKEQHIHELYGDFSKFVGYKFLVGLRYEKGRYIQQHFTETGVCD